MKFADFKLLKVDFAVNQKFDTKNKEQSVSPKLSLNFEFRDSEQELVVLVGVMQKSGNIPYYFEVQAGGLFKFKSRPDEKMLKQLETINCPAIIFPYLRETIADLTRRAGFPPLHLAPINFVELSKNLPGKKKGKLGCDM
jgi:preprotein translocase subunit SecB